MCTSLLVLSLVTCKNAGSMKRNNKSHGKNIERRYNIQETAVEMPCSRDELEEFVASEEISRNNEKRKMKMPVFSSPWPERSVENEDGDKEMDYEPSKVVIPLETEPKRREPGVVVYDKPISPPLKVVIPIDIEAKKTELGRVVYDKPRWPSLKVVIPIEIEPKRTDSEKTEYNKKNKEETYLDMSLYTNQTNNGEFLPTPPPSSEQKQQHEGQEYRSMSLEHIYELVV